MLEYRACIVGETNYFVLLVFLVSGRIYLTTIAFNFACFIFPYILERQVYKYFSLTHNLFSFNFN